MKNRTEKGKERKKKETKEEQEEREKEEKRKNAVSLSQAPPAPGWQRGVRVACGF